MRALLDVNVLIALLDQDHALHARAVDRFAGHGEAGWASCPITLALARHRKGRFVTFDAAVPLAAVAGATERDLVVL